MKLKVITTVSSLDNEGLIKLKKSLEYHKHDYLIIHDPSLDWAWGGWHQLYKWALDQSQIQGGYTHFIYTDGFDTFCLGAQSEAEEAYKKICHDDLDCFVYSTEKACYPISEWDQEYYSRYPHLINDPKYRWRFVNGGQFMTSITQFIKMYQQIDLTINSQHWGHKKFLFDNSDNKVRLDWECTIFQSVAFSGKDHNSEDEFSIVPVDMFYDDDTQEEIYNGKRILNNYTKSKPVFAHANGMKGEDFRLNFQFVYSCLNL